MVPIQTLPQHLKHLIQHASFTQALFHSLTFTLWRCIREQLGLVCCPNLQLVDDLIYLLIYSQHECLWRLTHCCLFWASEELCVFDTKVFVGFQGMQSLLFTEDRFPVCPRETHSHSHSYSHFIPSESQVNLTSMPSDCGRELEDAGWACDTLSLSFQKRGCHWIRQSVLFLADRSAWCGLLLQYTSASSLMCCGFRDVSSDLWHQWGRFSQRSAVDAACCLFRASSVNNCVQSPDRSAE